MANNKSQSLGQPKLFTRNITIRSVVMSIVRLSLWAMHSIKDKAKYLVLTPSLMAKQIVYDKKEKKFIPIFIRDIIDYYTMGQIYGNDDYGTSKLKRHGEIQGFYKKSRQLKKPLIIDCGGNIGLASKYFAENYAEAKVICIEPDGANIEQAKKNNRFAKNVDFMEAAVGSENGRARILDPGLGNHGYRVTAASNGNTAIVSINDLLRKYDTNVYTPFIIKIDIEGYEWDLFSKNIEWVDLFPLLIIELHDWMLPHTSNSRNFLKAISSLDRDFVYSGENVFSISNKLL